MTATRGLLQIGDVAERTGLSLRTIRHYEDVGLIPAAERSPGGFRLYSEIAVARLLTIKQVKPLGFSLDQLREALAVLDAAAHSPTPASRAQLTELHQTVISRIAVLTAHLSHARTFSQALEDTLSASDLARA
jgi:DNA-binding transcriptional MerR regulator